MDKYFKWILYTSMEENCYTEDILYSSHIKNDQENYSLLSLASFQCCRKWKNFTEFGKKMEYDGKRNFYAENFEIRKYSKKA